MNNNQEIFLTLKRLNLMSAQAHDDKKIKKFIVNKLGKKFNADRCFIMDYDPAQERYSLPDIKSEYLSSEEVNSSKEFYFLPELNNLIKSIAGEKNLVVINDTQDFIEQKGIKNTVFEDYVKQFSVKSGIFYFLKIHKTETVALFALHYTKEQVKFTKTDLQYIKIILSQVSSLIYQTQQTQQLEKIIKKESLLREIIETARSTLDVEEIEKIIVNSIGKSLNADRVFIREFDEEQNIYLPVKHEYKILPDLKSIMTLDFEKEAPEIADKSKTAIVIIENTEEYLKKNNIQDSLSAIYLRKMQVKSAFSIPMFYSDKLIGLLVIHFTKRTGTFKENEIEFVQTLANKTAIAIYQAKLYHLHKKYSELFDTASDAIMLLDKKKFIDCNQRTLELFGCNTRKVFFTKHPADLSPEVQPDGTDSFTSANEKIQTAFKKGYNRFDWMHKRLDNGAIFPAEVILKVIEIEGKKLLQATVRDITERKEAEEKILKYTKERDAILNNIPFWAWMKDKDGKYIAINEKYADAVYLKPEDVIGKTDFDIYPAELAQVYRDNDSYVMNTGEQITVEEEISEYGKRMVAESFKSPVYDEKGNIVATAGVCRDITERKEAEEKILKYTQELLQNQALIEKTAQRESFLKNIYSIINKTLDINLVIQEVVEKLCKIMYANRAVFRIVNKQKHFVEKEVFIEYLSTPNIKSFSELPISYDLAVNFTQTAIKNDNVYFMEDMKNYVIQNIKEEYYREKWLAYVENSGVKTDIVVDILETNEQRAFFVLHYTENLFYLSTQEINLLNTIAEQLKIAYINRNLFMEVKQTAERERILRTIISEITSAQDIKQIKKTLVTAIGKHFNFSRCFVSDYNPITDNLTPIEEYSEFRSSKDVKSVEGFNYTTHGLNFFKELGKNKQETFEEDLSKFLELNKEQINEEILNYFEEYNIKSGFQIPLYYGDEFLGLLAAHSDKIYEKFNGEEKEFIRTLSQQASIAIYQNKIFNKITQTAARETLLRKIISLISSTLNIYDIRKTLVNEIGRYFKANRCFLILPKGEGSYIPEESQYLYPASLKSMLDLKETDWKKIFPDFYSQKEEFNIPDIPKFITDNKLENTFVGKFLKEYNIKSNYGIPIFYENKVQGALCLHFTDSFVDLSEENINFLRTIANQASIAMNQSLLFEKEKITAGRELLLRKIINKIRSSLDIDFIKKQIVTEFGKALNSDRSFIIEYDKTSDKFLKVKEEYLSSPNLSSYVNIDINEEVPHFADVLKNGKEIIAHDIEDFIKNSDLALEPELKAIKRHKVKSALAIPIYYYNELQGALAIHYVNQKFYFGLQELELIRSIADQTGIALHQAKLYSNLKDTAEREKILREILAMIRNSLNINEIKREIVNQTGKYFNSDRCFIRLYKQFEDKFDPLDEFSEYLSSEDIESIIFLEKGEPEIIGHKRILELMKQNKPNIIEDTQKIFSEKSTPESIKKIIDFYKVKSDYGIPLFYSGELIGALVLHYIKQPVILKEQDINLIKIIADQASIAIKQAELYEKAFKQSYKEKILRELISEIKLSIDLNQAYNTLLKKISEIFSVNRVIFLESDPVEKNELIVKYEFMNNNTGDAINNLKFPKICIDRFLVLIHDLKTLVINDVSECYSDDTSLEFFEKYKINSILAIPLVKYNKKTRVLGFIILCAHEKRSWMSDEINLLKSISESIISVIWEITKLTEIEELRNSFVLTLAHDFQVPLVGERRALEYLLIVPQDQPLAKYKEIIEETIKSNISISSLLGKIVDIYNYESGKKVLHLHTHSLLEPVLEIMHNLQNFADLKGIRFYTFIDSDLPLIEFDIDEIKRVLYTLTENAIVHSPNKSVIDINIYRDNDDLIFKISDKGPGIPIEVQERLFKRYEMALAIERKIGGGVGIYLAKQIIESHGGRIWLETEIDKGTSFYFSLPVKYEI